MRGSHRVRCASANQMFEPVRQTVMSTFSTHMHGAPGTLLEAALVVNTVLGQHRKRRYAIKYAECLKQKTYCE